MVEVVEIAQRLPDDGVLVIRNGPRATIVVGALLAIGAARAVPLGLLSPDEWSTLSGDLSWRRRCAIARGQSLARRR